MADLTTTANVKEYLGITSIDDDTLIGNLVTRVSRGIETYCNRTFNSTVYSKERYDPTKTQLIYVNNYPLISLTRVSVGRMEILEVANSDSSTTSATVSVSDTGITLSSNGGDNDGDTTITFAGFATMTLMATEISTNASWTGSVADSDFNSMASSELIPVGARETNDNTIGLEVPNERLTDIQVDFAEGSIYRNIGFWGRWNDVFLDYTGGFATIPADLEQIAIEITAEVFQSRTTNNTLKSEKIGDYSYTNVDSSQGIRSVIIGHSDDLSLWRREVYA